MSVSNWSVRCVVILWLRSGFVVVLKCCCGSKIYYCGVCKYLVSWFMFVRLVKVC